MKDLVAKLTLQGQQQQQPQQHSTEISRVWSNSSADIDSESAKVIAELQAKLAEKQNALALEFDEDKQAEQKVCIYICAVFHCLLRYLFYMVHKAAIIIIRVILSSAYTV